MATHQVVIESLSGTGVTLHVDGVDLSGMVRAGGVGIDLDTDGRAHITLKLQPMALVLRQPEAVVNVVDALRAESPTA